MPELLHVDLGRCDYQTACRLQRNLLDKAIADPAAPAHLLLVEHDPPVITLGRRGCRTDIVASAEQLAKAGVQIHETARGGEVTYHGPGQLVVYPIMRLGSLSVRQYVRNLEEVVLRVLAGFGIEGRRDENQRGVWVGGDKIASVGIAVRKWAAWHGLALNVSTNLSHFDFIVPCGRRETSMTSMSKLLGSQPDMGEVKRRMIHRFAAVFGLDTESGRTAATNR